MIREEKILIGDTGEILEYFTNLVVEGERNLKFLEHRSLQTQVEKILHRSCEGMGEICYGEFSKENPDPHHMINYHVQYVKIENDYL